MVDNFTPQTGFEKAAIVVLEKQGWIVTGGDRQGSDLDLFVQFEGVRGKIAFRSAPASNLSFFFSGPDHCSIRVELGDPIVAATRWSLWDEYTFPEDFKYVVTICHEAIGDGWTQVSLKIASGNGSYRSLNPTMEKLLVRAESLSPSRDEATRRRELYLTQRSNYGVQEKKLSIAGLIMGSCSFFSPRLHGSPSFCSMR